MANFIEFLKSTILGLEGCSGVQYNEKQNTFGDRMGRTHDRHGTGLYARSSD